MPLRRLSLQPADPLLRLIGAHAADPRADRIDLGVGVFRDARGETPVMRAVKQAEERLLATQRTKAYLGPEGDAGFVAALRPLVFGDAVDAARLAGIQTPGGTGALRLAAELMARAGVARIWIGAPSWANHAPILAAAGLEPMSFAMFDPAAQRIDMAATAAALEQAAPGDAILLHGCCHNPTGIDPDAAAWSALIALVHGRRLLPLVDLAYQGLGRGWEEDAAGLRALLAGAEGALIAYSCDKNFGLYRERTGAVWALGGDGAAAAVLMSNMLALARANWSMPPDHGAAVVRTILEDAPLAGDWRAELETMRVRLVSLRLALAGAGRCGTVDLAALATGQGMFAVLPLTASQIEWLRSARGIYMAGSGRINIAGFADEDAVAAFADALARLPAG